MSTTSDMARAGMTDCEFLFGDRGCKRKLLTEPANPECPWHGERLCKGCGEVVGEGGLEHYVSSVGHLTSLSDAIEPYYTCQLGPGCDTPVPPTSPT